MDNERTERTRCKFLRSRSEHQKIVEFPGRPKENEKGRKQVHSSERGFFALQKNHNKSKNNNYQKIYASMAHISDNEECSCRDIGESLQPIGFYIKEKRVI